MTIGIAGASGFIGYHLYAFLKGKGIGTVGTYHSRRKEGLVKLDLLKGGFSVFDGCSHVVIAAGITTIDTCLLRSEEAYACNVTGTIHLIRYLEEKGITPVFLSSDQVFNGRRGGYTESDEPDPVNRYGAFKLTVERFMQEHLSKCLVLRLSKTYSRSLSDGGMYADIYAGLKEGRKVRAAYDQIYNPTDIAVVCEGVHQAIRADLNGLYHLADKTVMSRYEFALQVAREHGFDQRLVEKVAFDSFGLPEKRALNSSLNVEKFRGACKTP